MAFGAERPLARDGRIGEGEKVGVPATWSWVTGVPYSVGWSLTVERTIRVRTIRRARRRRASCRTRTDTTGGGGSALSPEEMGHEHAPASAFLRDPVAQPGAIRPASVATGMGDAGATAEAGAAGA